MRQLTLSAAIALIFAIVPAAQAQPAATGPEATTRYFATPLEKDPSRVVRMQMQTHAPGKPGNPFHTHDGDQWQVVLEGEITFTVRGQPPRLLKANEWVYIPRGTVHRNENLSGKPVRTIELMIADKDKPPVTRVPD